MVGFLRRVRDLLHLAITGRARKVSRAVAYRIYSNSVSLGLRRDLTVPFAAPSAKRPIHVRPLTPTDDLSCLDVRQPGLSDDQVYGRLSQVRLLQSGIRTCHVAVDGDGESKPCYI